jgi:hypothetical protein
VHNLFRSVPPGSCCAVILSSAALQGKAEGSVCLTCEVNAGERESDEKIKDEESDDTINGHITGWLNPWSLIKTNGRNTGHVVPLPV